MKRRAIFLQRRRQSHITYGNDAASVRVQSIYYRVVKERLAATSCTFNKKQSTVLIIGVQSTQHVFDVMLLVDCVVIVVHPFQYLLHPYRYLVQVDVDTVIDEKMTVYR